MRPALSLKSRERRVGFALTVPALLAFAVMILLPFVQSFRLAFYKFTIDMQAPVFVGLANFTRILSDPGMATVWGNTLVFVVLTTGLTLLLGLAWALVMNQTFWGRSLLRSLSLLPWVLPTTVTAFLAAWIFNGQYGVLNAALVRLGVLEQPITWLAEPAGAMAAVILAKVWLSVPLFMAFFWPVCKRSRKTSSMPRGSMAAPTGACCAMWCCRICCPRWWWSPCLGRWAICRPST
jgi:multiple sugar transport system permease protein